MDNTFIPLHCLAGRLDLPMTFLKRLADEKKIPFIVAGKRKRFNQADVCNAIRRMTTSQNCGFDINEQEVQSAMIEQRGQQHG